MVSVPDLAELGFLLWRKFRFLRTWGTDWSTLDMLFIIQGEKLCKNLWISMAKFWIFLWWAENDYLFLEAHKTMICSRNKCRNLYCHFINPGGNHIFKVNNKNTRARCEICSKLTIKTPSFWCLYCSLWACNCRLGRRLILVFNVHIQIKGLIKWQSG